MHGSEFDFEHGLVHFCPAANHQPVQIVEGFPEWRTNIVGQAARPCFQFSNEGSGCVDVERYFIAA